MPKPRAEAAQGPAASPLVVGVTSHRNLAPAKLESIRAQVRDLLGSLRQAFPSSPLTLLSPLAEGGDQLVAEEALALGARLVAPLPLPRALYAQDFEDPDLRRRFDALCAQARVLELPLLPGHGESDVAVTGDARDRHYAQAGLFVARHCHVLLALWDGKPSDQTGGTAQIVDYFLNGTPPGGVERRRLRRPRLHAGGDERLLWHLVCSRNAADGAPAAPWQPGQVVWRGGDEQVIMGGPLPRLFRTAFALADEFNEDAAKYAASIAAEGATIADAPPSPGSEELRSPSSPASLFRAADWLAVHFQRRVLLAMRAIYVVAFVMGVAFTLYGNSPAQDGMLYLFLALFATGIMVSAVARRRGWHRKYLDYRALAEGLRVQCHWRRAGISLTEDPEFAQDNLLQKQDVELGWVRNVMRSAGLSDDPSPIAPDATVVRGVIDDWVGDPAHGELGYYRARFRQRERAHRANEMIGRLALVAGIVISVLLAVFASELSDGSKDDLMVVMAAFSIFAAVREAYSFRKADRELIRQYRFMERVFGNARRALDEAADADAQREILRALGEAALAEHVEWAVMHRQRPLEAGKI